MYEARICLKVASREKLESLNRCIGPIKILSYFFCLLNISCTAMYSVCWALVFRRLGILVQDKILFLHSVCAIQMNLLRSESHQVKKARFIGIHNQLNITNIRKIVGLLITASLLHQHFIFRRLDFQQVQFSEM